MLQPASQSYSTALSLNRNSGVPADGPLARTNLDDALYLRCYFYWLSTALLCDVDVGAGWLAKFFLKRCSFPHCSIPLGDVFFFMDIPPLLSERIGQSGQSACLAFWDRLNPVSQARLLHQLQALDWDQLDVLRELVSQPIATDAGLTGNLSDATTPACLQVGNPLNAPSPAQALARGSLALAEGTVGAILVAGGQGTRLGCAGPKGLYAIGPVSQASLFEMLLGKLLGVRRRFGKDVPLAIMTSSATDADTHAYLRSHAYCGLDPAHVFVFCQQDLPALDAATGCLLLEASDRVAVAPDGHGGMLGALSQSGGLDWFAQRGTEQIVSFQVDNPLAMPLDREFLGYHLVCQADFSTQIVRKLDPAQRVGVVVAHAGTHRVVEYSDLPATLASERLANGRLRFDAGSIAVHAFAKSFLDRVAAIPNALPLHRALKSVPVWDASGRQVVPHAPNAVKFERFIFDLMPLAHRVCVVEVPASQGFAPLKNPSGAASDSPQHVRAALVQHARTQLEKAGVFVADGIDVELDAASILDHEDIGRVLLPGSRIDRPQVVGGEASRQPADRTTQNVLHPLPRRQ